MGDQVSLVTPTLDRKESEQIIATKLTAGNGHRQHGGGKVREIPPNCPNNSGFAIIRRDNLLVLPVNGLFHAYISRFDTSRR